MQDLGKKGRKEVRLCWSHCALTEKQVIKYIGRLGERRISYQIQGTVLVLKSSGPSQPRLDDQRFKSVRVLRAAATSALRGAGFANRLVCALLSGSAEP